MKGGGFGVGIILFIGGLIEMSGAYPNLASADSALDERFVLIGLTLFVIGMVLIIDGLKPKGSGGNSK
ncbi:MAG: hypothetical protein QXQ46_04365 [Thermoplasmatales archaeon]